MSHNRWEPANLAVLTTSAFKPLSCSRLPKIMKPFRARKTIHSRRKSLIPPTRYHPWRSTKLESRANLPVSVEPPKKRCHPSICTQMEPWEPLIKTTAFQSGTRPTRSKSRSWSLCHIQVNYLHRAADNSMILITAKIIWISTLKIIILEAPKTVMLYCHRLK